MNDDPSSHERIEIQRLESTPDAELFDVRNSTRLWRVFHESYDICLVPIAGNHPAGVAHLWYRGQMHRAVPGSVTLTEPGEMHLTKRVEFPAAHYWFMQIQPVAVMSAAAELGTSVPHLRLAVTTARRLYQSFAALYTTIEDPSEGSLAQQIVFARCMRLMITDCSESNVPRPARPSRLHLERVREMIRARYTQTLRLDELAAVAGISRFHLAHEFARAYGLPPHAYQNALRIAEAMRQLRAGVPAAVVDVGFSDQSHLTRHFKRTFGVTPGEYSRAIAI